LFEWNGETWDVIQSFNGPGAGAEGGSSVALSRDGRRTVIGAPFWADGIGQVAIYEQQVTDGNADDEWIQVGQPILAGNLKGDSPAFGTSVTMSKDGTILAVSAPYAQSSDGILINAGVVRVYQEKNSVWNQMGSDLEGDAMSSVFGTSIALSADGMRIAVGSPSGAGSKSGLVNVFDFERSEWTSVGQILTASDDSTTNYGFSLALSDDGLILAVGALGKQQATSSGVVQVYRIMEDEWFALGKAMLGTNPSDHFGKSVALSADGQTIAIGSPRADGVVVGTGKVTVLKYNGMSWIQEKGVISGSSNGEALGSSVAISGLGKVVAGGAPNYNFDGLQSNVGKVQIYRSSAGA
jgi:WD40 repeat protein